MKRVKRVFTHQRHWLWYGFSGATMVAGAVSQVVSSDSHPVAFLALSLVSGLGGIVAQVCRPQDLGDGN